MAHYMHVSAGEAQSGDVSSFCVLPFLGFLLSIFEELVAQLQEEAGQKKERRKDEERMKKGLFDNVKITLCANCSKQIVASISGVTIEKC